MSFQINPIRVSSNDIDVHPFLPSHPSLVGIVAPRKSGKTTLLVNMLTRDDMYKNFFHEIHIWSPTIKLDRKWEKVTKYLPDEWVHDHFSDEEFMDIMGKIQRRIEGDDKNMEKQSTEKQKALANNPVLIRPQKTLKQMREDAKQSLTQYEKKLDEKKKLKPRRVLFVFDDSAAEKGLFTRNFASPAVKAAFTSRHYGVSLWVVSQAYKAINTCFRNNIFHWIIFNTPNEKEGDRMAQELNGPLSTYQFQKLLNDVTSEPFQFLYINFEANKKSDIFRKGFGPPIDLTSYLQVKRQRISKDAALQPQVYEGGEEKGEEDEEEASPRSGRSSDS